jgi:hypothetical protein
MNKVIAVFLAFMSPLAPLALIISLFSIVDTFIGRWYAKQKGEIITSRKTRIGLCKKLLVYFTVLLLAYLVDRFIINEIMRNYIWFDWAFTKFFSTVLIWIEYTSIDEKIKWIKGKGLTDRVVDFAKQLKKMVGFTKNLNQ